MVKCKIFKIGFCLEIQSHIEMVFSVPFLHSPFAPATVPSGQTQATERVGKVSATTHCCCPRHGLFSLHGFWQDSEIQDNFDGQS